MYATLCLLHARLDRSTRSAHALAFLSILAAAFAMLAPESALADGEGGEGFDPWTQLVLAAVRVFLLVLQLPPIHACPC